MHPIRLKIRAKKPAFSVAASLKANHQQAKENYDVAYAKLDKANIVVAKKLMVFKTTKALDVLNDLYKALTDGIENPDTSNFLEFAAEIDAVASKYRQTPLKDKDIEKLSSDIADTSEGENNAKSSDEETSEDEETKEEIKERIAQASTSALVFDHIIKQMKKGKDTFNLAGVRAQVPTATNSEVVTALSYHEIEFVTTRANNDINYTIVA